jgi:DNA processing protein
MLVGLPRAPAALWAEGNLTLLRQPAVAVVGARRCTAWGRAWASRIGEAVAAAGGVVVSGLAAGIDAEGHVAANGHTIAVLGQGLDARMPAWQARLRERILDSGALVLSEFAPGIPAAAWTFPTRNRIIAGLARAVVVVEAAQRSGTKNTARHALEYGRDVLVVPGSPESETSAGCLDLIEEGATLVRGPETVIEHLLSRSQPR